MKLKKGKEAEKIAKKFVAKKRKKNLAEVTTDEFFNQDFENMDLSDSEDDKKEKDKKQAQDRLDKLAQKALKQSSKIIKSKQGKSSQQSDEDSDSDDSCLNVKAHKKALSNLKETDPEFFRYLKHNDTKLLDFNVSDEENDAVLSSDDDNLKHIPDDDLEVASNESDYDYEEEGKEKIVSDGNKIKVTFKLIQTWEEEIQTDKSIKTIKCLVDAYHAALESVCDSETQTTPYKVEGGAIFNGIMQLCMLQLPAAFKKYLKIENEDKFDAHKSKRFPKVKRLLKSYLADLIKVFENVSSVHVITTLLKHLHQMVPFTKSFSTLRKPLLRILLKYWSTGEEETIRVIAFLCIIKIAVSQGTVLNGLLKTMYIKYVENAKFVSPTTLPAINFMRRSLTEMYLLHNDISYYNAFLYIRQLAIHLRNALTLKKKEHFQTVYNWQYINSLWFWTDLISVSKKGSMLRNLLYPLVQITIGVIKLIPTMQYYPLRFHCVKMLINISRETGKFIPTLPLLLEILDTYNFNTRHKVVSMKPLSLICMLRASKKQTQENGYKDAIIENIYELVLEGAAKDSACIYFPDMYFFCIYKIKAFLKKCHVAVYCRKIKQLLNKIEESIKFLETERAKQVFDLKDLPKIEAWETKIRSAGTPVSKFYDSWVKVHQEQQLKLITQNDQEAADFKLPKMKKSKRFKNRQDDSDENSDLEIPVEEMERRLQKAKKPKKMKVNKDKKEDIKLPTDNTDIVQDIKVSDWD